MSEVNTWVLHNFNKTRFGLFTTAVSLLRKLNKCFCIRKSVNLFCAFPLFFIRSMMAEFFGRLKQTEVKQCCRYEYLSFCDKSSLSLSFMQNVGCICGNVLTKHCCALLLQITGGMLPKHWHVEQEWYGWGGGIVRSDQTRSAGNNFALGYFQVGLNINTWRFTLKSHVTSHDSTWHDRATTASQGRGWVRVRQWGGGPWRHPGIPVERSRDYHENLVPHFRQVALFGRRSEPTLAIQMSAGPDSHWHRSPRKVCGQDGTGVRAWVGGWSWSEG